MFRPLSLFIGLRYVRARSHKFFVSFITWVSLLGVCVGVAALIVILSVMNGFEGELRDRLLSMSSHARVELPATLAVDDVKQSAVLRVIRAVPGVIGAAPFRELQALAVHGVEMLPLQLRGIDPVLEPQVTQAASAMLEGKLTDLRAEGGIVLGSLIAQQLGVATGDRVTLLVPAFDVSGAPAPKLQEFQVVGLFEVGLQDSDGVLALVSLHDVLALLQDGGGAAASSATTGSGAGIHLRFDSALRAPQRAAAVADALRASCAPRACPVIDWSVDHASYFRAIRIEKTMMALILLLIVAVAAFNIVAMLVMVVNDKRTDIAILRTQGASPRTIMGVFATQGLVIGWSGVLLGVALGVVLARNVGSIAPWLERTLRFQIMDADVYYITRIPSELQLSNVLWIGGAALLLTALATVYPALRASRVAPADALRYE